MRIETEEGEQVEKKEEEKGRMHAWETSSRREREESRLKKRRRK